MNEREIHTKIKENNVGVFHARSTRQHPLSLSKRLTITPSCTRSSHRFPFVYISLSVYLKSISTSILPFLPSRARHRSLSRMPRGIWDSQSLAGRASLSLSLSLCLPRILQRSLLKALCIIHRKLSFFP